jgi:hypothetical protein
MPEWGVTGTVYLQQITSYAFAATSPLFGPESQPELHFAVARPTTFSYSPLPYWFFQLGHQFISLPASRRGGRGSNRECRNWLDFGLDNRDIATRFLGRASNFTVFQNAQTDSGADPLSYLRDTGTFSPGTKRSWQQADHSPPHSVNVQKGWMFLHPSHVPPCHSANFTFWYISCFFSVATQIVYWTHPHSTTS